MYQIIATDDFVDIIKDIPLKHIGVLSKSFLSIKKLTKDEILNAENNKFINDILSQIKNEEKE